MGRAALVLRTALDQGRLAPGAVADPDGSDDLGHENHPIAAEAALALVLDDLDEPLELRVRADDLELDNREMPVAIDHPGLEPLEGIRLVAIPERMDLDDRHTGRACGPEPLHELTDLVASDVGSDLLHGGASRSIAGLARGRASAASFSAPRPIDCRRQCCGKASRQRL